jgi:hypothetical protein
MIFIQPTRPQRAADLLYLSQLSIATGSAMYLLVHVEVIRYTAIQFSIPTTANLLAIETEALVVSRCHMHISYTRQL